MFSLKCEVDCCERSERNFFLQIYVKTSGIFKLIQYFNLTRRIVSFDWLFDCITGGEKEVSKCSIHAHWQCLTLNTSYPTPKWVVDFSQATKWDEPWAIVRSWWTNDRERTIANVPTQSPMVHNVTDVKMRCKSMSASQPNNAMH